MVINPTYLAQRSRQWFWEATEPGSVLYVRRTPDAYALEGRQLDVKVPELIETVAGPRDPDDFERHRYVNHLGTVDKLLQHSNAEYQVRLGTGSGLLCLSSCGMRSCSDWDLEMWVGLYLARMGDELERMSHGLSMSRSNKKGHWQTRQRRATSSLNC
ncbi:hypothetical protein CJF32_00004690 [Rutstroemia sp. NJR-2017a WRK4]|nr:hypothetical protein CJF32_00004690 [Rutstroemia sp. NJR-2017a WRK4]